MNILKKIKKTIIYQLTDKPVHYVHVDKLKSLQDYRQLQYNKWCKAYGVYNGSYLPEDPDKLLHKGWVDITHRGNNDNRQFVRKSSKQEIRFDPENNDQIPHYHWINPISTKSKKLYLDRYGQTCTKHDPSHHLAPLDKDCPKNAKKRYLK